MHLMVTGGCKDASEHHHTRDIISRVLYRFHSGEQCDKVLRARGILRAAGVNHYLRGHVRLRPGPHRSNGSLKILWNGVLVTRPRHTLRTGEVIIDAVADSRGAQVAAALGIDDPVQVWLDDEPKILPEIRFEVLWARAPEGACQR